MTTPEQLDLFPAPPISPVLHADLGGILVPLRTDLAVALQAIVREHLDHLIPSAAMLQDVFDAALRSLATTVKPGSRRFALLADDESGLLICFGVFLEAHGYDVVCTSSGAEAIDELRSERDYDLLVSDDSVFGDGRAAFMSKVRELRPAIETIFLSDLHDPGISAPQSVGSDIHPTNVICLHETPQWRSRHVAPSGTVAA